MRIYEKIRKFFDFLGSIYFRLDYFETLSGHTEQLNKISSELSGEVGRFKQRAEQLALENNELISTITTHSKELGDLKSSVIELTKQKGGLEYSINELTEQKSLLAEELATAQENLSTYQKGVLESPEYVELATKKDELEDEVGDLEKQVSDLEKGRMFRQKTIKELRGKINVYWSQYSIKQEELIEKEAENDNRALSYVIVDNDGKIIASTPTFKENFHYNEIKGTKCSLVLKAPEPNGNVENWIRLTAFLQDQEEDSLEATMLDGKKSHRNIYLEKQKPTIIQCTEYDENGKPNNYNLVYRRIDVHDIGFWKKFSKEHRKRKIRSLDEYFAVLKLDEVEIENEEFREAMDYYSLHLRQRGLNLTQVLRVWDKLRNKERNYKNWRRGCAGLILEKRNAERKKREKQAEEQKKDSVASLKDD